MLGLLIVLVFHCFSSVTGQFTFNFDELQHVLYNVNIERHPVVVSSKQEHEASFTGDYEELTLVSRFGQPFQCTVPSANYFVKRAVNQSAVDSDLTSEEDTTVREAIDGFQTLPCLLLTQDWWTYELCYRKSIKQFHLTGGKVDGETTFLGHFERDMNWTEVKRERKLKKGVQQFYAHIYSGGSVCDLTGRPRSAEVRYVCDPDSSVPHALKSVTEPESCTYVVNVHLVALCNSSLRPLSSDSGDHVAIQCSPVVDQETFARYEQLREQQQQAEAVRVAMAIEAKLSSDKGAEHAADGTVAEPVLSGDQAKAGDTKAEPEDAVSEKQQSRKAYGEFGWAEATLNRIAEDFQDDEEILFYDDETNELLNDEEMDVFDFEVLVDMDENGKPIIRTVLRDEDEHDDSVNEESDKSATATAERQLSKSKAKRHRTANRDESESAESSPEDLQSPSESAEKNSGEQRQHDKVSAKSDTADSPESASVSEQKQTHSESQKHETAEQKDGDGDGLAKRLESLQKLTKLASRVDLERDELKKLVEQIGSRLSKVKATSPSASDSESDELDSKSQSQSNEDADDDHSDSEEGQLSKRKANRKKRRSNDDVVYDNVMKMALNAISKMLDEENDRNAYATKKELENFDVRFVNGHRKPDDETTPAERPNEAAESDDEAPLVRLYGNNIFLIEVATETERKQAKKERETKRQQLELQRHYNRLWNDAL